MQDDVAGPDGSALSEGLGPLPEGREHIAGMNRHFAKVCGTVTAYSADDMHAYARQERAAERERFVEALADACMAAEIPDSKFESLMIALRA